MVTRLLALAAAAGLLFVGTPAIAADVTTTTHTRQGVVETFVDVVPSCEGGGPRYNITTTANLLIHRTRFADGRRHVTFTSTGTFVAVPRNDPTLPSYTGKFTQWGGFNLNGQEANGTFTFAVRGTGSDGSSFNIHFLDHFDGRLDGTVHQFFRCH